MEAAVTCFSTLNASSILGGGLSESIDNLAVWEESATTSMSSRNKEFPIGSQFQCQELKLNNEADDSVSAINVVLTQLFCLVPFEHFQYESYNRALNSRRFKRLKILVQDRFP